MILWLALACAGTTESPRATAAPAAVPTPYGFWGLNGFLTPEALPALKARLGMTLVMTATTDTRYAVEELLPMARAAGVRVMLRLSGDHPRYTRDGNFTLELWKQQLSLWDGVNLAPFVADGTLAGHMLLDDIKNFEGHDPTAAELDEMARYSKEKFPGLFVFVRERASGMPVPAGGRYAHVNAVVNQYKTLDGPVEAFLALDLAASRRLGVGNIHGLNIANGGDGSSKQPGWAKGRFAMSADEILRYGRVLAADPSYVAFLNWEYDGTERWSDGSVGADYFARPEVEAALAELGRLVAGRR